jgi:hypothetical protein
MRGLTCKVFDGAKPHFKVCSMKRAGIGFVMSKIMKPLFFTIDNRLNLKVVPEAEGQLDRHPVIDYKYSIF